MRYLEQSGEVINTGHGGVGDIDVETKHTYKAFTSIKDLALKISCSHDLDFDHNEFRAIKTKL